MKLAEDRLIAAPSDVVWNALLDAEVLKECIPGCEELTGSPQDGFEAVVTQKVGPVKATFRGKVTLSDVIEGESLRLEGEGKGGAAGFAKGGANVSMASEGDGTRLTYEAEAKVGGKLAQLGSRIIDSFARKLADQFFGNFQTVVETRAGTAPVAENDDAAPEEKKGWIKRVFS